ncbi:hypothetical protein GQ43DRAFT_376328 [Delitschia confertaspora ATCC 74209]|uniref:Pentatricopeptide repeat protein n=1 Tax=Delitschia confertaspora ATCC 74209 TaxID=1513339 RepID=A0A9P4MWY5_9PLEO|nr:hypothetical protein GQ43DRAFT_376328 [Delitschia confertaspora ATCC 74209]
MELLDFDSRMPGAPRLSWPINTGPDLLRWNLPPQSLWSTDSSRRRAIKQRHVWKKLAISELATAKLICYLVLKSNVHQLQEEFFDDLPESIQDIVRRSRPRVQRDLADISFHLESAYRMADDSPVHEIEQAEYIRRGFLVVPEYTQDDDGQFLFVAQQLNAAIRAAFSSDQLSSAPEQQSLAVAKICHNLLISSAPPDVQTYNLLILGFDRWNRPDLCREVITALDNAKVRPNELTCAAILNHYVNNNDPTGFSKFISRMRGVTNPLMLANPNIRITKAGQDRLIRTAAGKIKQKVYPTPLVFGALMRGALKFAGIERSMEIYLDMKEDGWGLDTQGISQLLEDCALRGAWVEGYLLWDEFRHLRSMGKIDRHMSKTYACMLGLCERTGKQVAYNQVLVEGVRAGLDRRRLASSAHAIALRAKALRGDEAPEEMDMNVGDSIFIALSDYGNDAREGGEEEKDSVTRRLGSWFRWGRNKRQEE